MESATKTSPQERFALAAVYAGCPRGQVENFISRAYVPFPKQLELHAAARSADYPGGPDQIGYGGARGPGKSTGIFAQLAIDDCQRRDGLKCLYLRKVGKQAREQLEDLRRKVLFATPHKYNRSSGVVNFPNGSRIIMGHFRTESEVDNYLGLEYDVIAIEETTTLTVTKYKALRDSNRTSRDDWRPRIYNSTNPGGVGHSWYRKRFVDPKEDGTETYTRFIPGTLDDNPFLDPGYKRKVEENTGWRLQAYRYGSWDIAAGQFFTNWDKERHVIKQPYPTVPLDWISWCGMDYGNVHPTVVYLLVMTNEGDIYVVDEYVASRQLVQNNAIAIKKMLERNYRSVDSLRTFVAGSDVFAEKEAGEPTIAKKYKKEGISLTAANSARISGAAQVMHLLGDERNKVRQRLFIFDRCTKLIETLPALEHDPKRPEDVLKWNIDEDGFGGDDSYDALRYSLMAIPSKSTGFVIPYT